MPRTSLRHAGFTIVELIVVLSIVAALIGLLMPVLTNTRKEVQKTTCASNLRQIGLAVQSYRTDNKDFLPRARYMPEPFVSVDEDPAFPVAMKSYLPSKDGQNNSVYRCPDDEVVYKLCGTSYDYVSMFGGQRPKDIFFIRLGMVTEAEVILSRDFDDAAADIDGADEPVEIPARHLRRNNLWLDGRVEVIENKG